jgi:hypothetical protein
VELATGGKKRNLAPEIWSLSGLAWWPDGRAVCFANWAAVRCVPLDGTAKTRLLTQGTQPLFLHDISARGDLLVTASTWLGSLVVSADGGPERDLARLTTSVPVDFSRDGSRLLFSEILDYAIRLGALDGSPSVRLGDGLPMGLSPDGRWVLVIAPQSPTQLLLLPTGPGGRRLLPRGGLVQHFGADWLPDGRRVVVSGAEPGKVPRLYLQDVEAGEPRPLSAEGCRLPLWSPRLVSPDGRQVLALDADMRPVLVPLDGGPPRLLSGFGDDLVPMGWTGDARTIFARPRSLARLWSIDRVDVLTGRRVPWRTVGPSDPTGTPLVYAVRVSPDGRQYAYSAMRFLSELCLVRGVPGAQTLGPSPRP